MQNVPDEEIYAISSITFHNLWHNGLYHSGEYITDKVHQNCDGMSRLSLRNPFFKCDGCHPNITKKMRDYNCDPE